MNQPLKAFLCVSALVSLGAVAYALDFPTIPYKHAIYDRSTVTQGTCHTVGESKQLVFWNTDGKRVVEQQQNPTQYCQYTCSKGRKWEAPDSVESESENAVISYWYSYENNGSICRYNTQTGERKCP